MIDDHNSLWKELGLQTLLGAANGSLGGSIVSSKGRHSAESNSSVKHQKLLKKPGYAAVMQRYNARPSKPKYVLSQKLEKLADPLLGRFSKYQKTLLEKPSKEHLNSIDSVSVSPKSTVARNANASRVVQPTHVDTAQIQGFFITEGDLSQEASNIPTRGKIHSVIVNNRKDTNRRYRLQQPILRPIIKAPVPASGEKLNFKKNKPVLSRNALSSGYGQARLSSLNVKKRGVFRKDGSYGTSRRQGVSYLAAHEQHPLVPKRKLLRSNSAINVSDEVNVKMRPQITMSNQVGKKASQLAREKVSKLRGTKSAPGKLNGVDQFARGPPKLICKLSPQMREKISDEDNFRLGGGGGSPPGVNQKTAKIKLSKNVTEGKKQSSTIQVTLAASRNIDDTTSKPRAAVIPREDSIHDTVEKLNKICVSNRSARARSGSGKTVKMQQLGTSERIGDFEGIQGAANLAQKARSISENLQNARIHLEQYKQLAGGT